MEAWIEELMPAATKLSPGLWRAVRDIEDGRCYSRETMTGTIYAVLRAQKDTDGRRWLTLMAGINRGKKSPLVPSWDEVRSLKGVFFGNEDVTSIIPVLPRNSQMTYAPAVINLWVCLDGSILPTWPSKIIAPPGWTPEEVQALQIQKDEQATAEAKEGTP